MPTVNMWCAHTPRLMKPMPTDARHHGRIAEDGLAREDGNDLVGEGEGGQHQDVDLGMAEDPEEVHPEHGRAAGLGIEEVRRRDSGRCISMICAAVSGLMATKTRHEMTR